MTQLAPLVFAEALAWAKGRRVTLPDVYYGELQGLARAMSFSVAGLAKLDQLQAVKDSLTEALESGETLRDWQKRVKAGDIGLDLPAHRLENIFRTNIQGNYARGRCEQQKRTAEAFPWYMYDATNDTRTRPAHAAMDGKVARHDDPWWDTHSPPNGYSCRCRRIQISDKQAARFQAADAKRMQDPELADARATAKPDKGWDYSVCSDPTEGLRRAVEAKRPRTDHRLMAAHDEAVAVEARRIAAVKAAIEAARDDCLAFGKANNRERMILIDDATGRELGRVDGTQSSVAFTDEMKRILQDPSNSARIIHNHPLSMSLSLSGLIAVKAHKGASAIEAIGHDGSLYIGGAGVGGIADGVTYSAAIKAVQIAFMAEVVAGNMSAHQAGDMFWHAVNTALAQAGIISYRAILSVRRQETLDGLGEAFDAAVKAAVAAIKKQAKP